jgi:hypothetical protein
MAICHTGFGRDPAEYEGGEFYLLRLHRHVFAALSNLGIGSWAGAGLDPRREVQLPSLTLIGAEGGGETGPLSRPPPPHH